MPRFVVLTHDHPFLHWDFMLEHDGALRTWRLSAPPDTKDCVAAEALPDHRLAYLDYEGAVSENRGSVERWDAGTYSQRFTGDERVAIVLQGEKLVGIGEFERTPKGLEWTFRPIPPSPEGS